jgi:hypothetical protein
MLGLPIVRLFALRIAGGVFGATRGRANVTDPWRVSVSYFQAEDAG